MQDNVDSSPSGKALAAELALRLHWQGGTELRIDVPADAVVTISDLPDGCQLVEDVALQFNSLATRNDIVAKAEFAGLQSSSGIDADALFERAYELWRHEIGHDDQASGRLLALASLRTDVLNIAAQRIRDGSDVFDVLHLVEATLPYLQVIEPLSIIDLVTAKYEPTKNDLAGGLIHGALESWLATRADSALKLHAKVLESLSEATASLLGNVVVALAKTDYGTAVEVAKDDVQSKSPLRARVGVWALGRLLLVKQAPSPCVDLVIQTIIDVVEREEGELRSCAIHAAAAAMHYTDAFDPILQRRAEDGDQDVLCAVTRALFFQAKELGERGITQRWLGLTTSLKPEFKGAIRDLDHAMARLLSDPANASMVTSTLKTWVAKHGLRVAVDSATAALFEFTVSKLFSLKPISASLVTDWLLSDEQTHPAALAGFLNQLDHHSCNELRLDDIRLDSLEAEDLLFLARRLLGYVHNRAQLTALALSMLQSQEPETRIYPVLHALLVNEIGYDYPESTATACRNAAESAPTDNQKGFLLMVAKKIDQVATKKNSLPMVNELRPPTRLRRLFARARAKQMSDSFEEASRDSFWRQIATQITIKAGRGTFSYRDANYGPSMKLASMSHSMELPRREAFDPIGNSIRHLGFRLAKRGES